MDTKHTSTPYAVGRDGRIPMRDENRIRRLDQETVGCVPLTLFAAGFCAVAWATWHLNAFIISTFGF